MASDSIKLYTYKAGLLSRVAHDLRLRVEPHGITIARTGDEVRATIDPRAIVVEGALGPGGQLEPRALSDRDRSKIIATIQAEILSVGRHPNIEFVGRVHERTGDRLEVRGELDLLGVRRPLRFTAMREAGRVRARVTVTPSEFGIAPYKALAGAIRLQDRVVVELDLD